MFNWESRVFILDNACGRDTRMGGRITKGRCASTLHYIMICAKCVMNTIPLLLKEMRWINGRDTHQQQTKRKQLFEQCGFALFDYCLSRHTVPRMPHATRLMVLLRGMTRSHQATYLSKIERVCLRDSGPYNNAVRPCPFHMTVHYFSVHHP